MSSSSTSSTLVVIGSGPGIGVHTASLFAAQKFTIIALISRNAINLERSRQRVLETAKSAGKSPEVRTWSTDITDAEMFKKTLKEVESMGVVSCVHFNAARVGLSDIGVFGENDLIQDFKVGDHDRRSEWGRADRLGHKCGIIYCRTVGNPSSPARNRQP